MNMENKGLGDANAEDGISIVWGGDTQTETPLCTVGLSVTSSPRSVLG